MTDWIAWTAALLRFLVIVGRALLSAMHQEVALRHLDRVIKERIMQKVSPMKDVWKTTLDDEARWIDS